MANFGIISREASTEERERDHLWLAGSKLLQFLFNRNISLVDVILLTDVIHANGELNDEQCTIMEAIHGEMGLINFERFVDNLIHALTDIQVSKVL